MEVLQYMQLKCTMNQPTMVSIQRDSAYMRVVFKTGSTVVTGAQPQGEVSL